MQAKIQFFNLRYFIEIAYNGSAYHGWQKQPDAVSVQEILEAALSTALQKKTEVVGAGRTDTGVHASQFFAHFDGEITMGADQLIFKLNTILPPDIAVFRIFEVSSEAHARFDAISREYHYFVSIRKNPFKTGSAYYIKKKIDLQRMNEAAEILMKHTNFKAFSKVKTEVKTFDCKIESAVWEQIGDQLIFKIKSDRFLRNMVRAIVGTLLDIGTHKTEVEDMQKIILGRNRCNAGKSVPAHALFLVNIEYPATITKQ